MLLATSWNDPLAVATFLLAVATAGMAWYTRRSVETSTQAAEAAKRAAKAAEDDVKIARTTLARAERPVLTDVPVKKYSIYALDATLPKVFIGADFTEVEVPLQNIGRGSAVILHPNPAPIIQFVPDENWYIGQVEHLLLPVGEATLFRATINIVPKPDIAGRLTIYCGVPYTDLTGAERATTYLCLRRDFESDSLEHGDKWSVHGVAIEQDGQLVHSGEGWEDFEPSR
jgi:hypothetical protein